MVVKSRVLCTGRRNIYAVESHYRRPMQACQQVYIMEFKNICRWIKIAQMCGLTNWFKRQTVCLVDLHRWTNVPANLVLNHETKCHGAKVIWSNPGDGGCSHFVIEICKTQGLTLHSDLQHAKTRLHTENQIGLPDIAGDKTLQVRRTKTQSKIKGQQKIT